MPEPMRRHGRHQPHLLSGTRAGPSGQSIRPLLESTSMVVTSTHIPAIVALIAGILILVMPRLLNLVVAIYLIFIGLVGLGLLKWLKF
jgi:hypothetical protein